MWLTVSNASTNSIVVKSHRFVKIKLRFYEITVIVEGNNDRVALDVSLLAVSLQT
jgi:hypothetical protein